MGEGFVLDFAEPGIATALAFDEPEGVTVGVGGTEGCFAGDDFGAASGDFDGFLLTVLGGGFHEFVGDGEHGTDGVGFEGAAFFEQADLSACGVRLFDFPRGVQRRLSCLGVHQFAAWVGTPSLWVVRTRFTGLPGY